MPSLRTLCNCSTYHGEWYCLLQYEFLEDRVCLALHFVSNAHWKSISWDRLQRRPGESMNSWYLNLVSLVWGSAHCRCSVTTEGGKVSIVWYHTLFILESHPVSRQCFLTHIHIGILWEMPGVSWHHSLYFQSGTNYHSYIKPMAQSSH